MICNVTITPSHYSGTLNGEADPILSYRLEYPTFSSQPAIPAQEILNQYYGGDNMQFLQYITGEFSRQALNNYQSQLKNNYLVIPYEAQSTYTAPYNQNCMLSIFQDRYLFTAGAHGQTERTSKTWNLAAGAPMELKEFFPHTEDYKAAVIRAVNRQIEKNPSYYFPDYKENTAKYFDESRFFVSPDGVHIYYQQYEIAPYSSGIPVFTIPFS